MIVYQFIDWRVSVLTNAPSPKNGCRELTDIRGLPKGRSPEEINLINCIILHMTLCPSIPRSVNSRLSYHDS
jgi:hypothetical protein